MRLGDTRGRGRSGKSIAGSERSGDKVRRE